MSRPQQTGTVVFLDTDTLTIRAGEVESRFGLDTVDDLRVWCRVEDPRGRAFKAGAVIGGLALGLPALALSACNPSLFGDGGCQGPDELADVLKISAVAAGTGALVVGLVSALYASSHEWLPVTTIAPTGARFSFRVPAGG